MIQLVAKDVRLAFDAVLVWLVVAVGIVLVAALARSLFPGLVAFSSSEVLSVLGAILHMAVAPTAALVAVAALHGDRRHRAAAFSAAIPVSERQRLVAKGTAIVLVAACPLAVAVLFDVVRSIEHPGGRDFTELPSLIGSMFASIGYASVAAACTTRLFEGWAWSLALATGALLAGAAGASASLAVTRGDEIFFYREITTSSAGLSAGVLLGAIAGAKCVGFAALGFGAWAHVRRVSKRPSGAVLACALIIAGLVGSEVAQFVAPLASQAFPVGASPLGGVIP